MNRFQQKTGQHEMSKGYKRTKGWSMTTQAEKNRVTSERNSNNHLLKRIGYGEKK